MSYHLQDPLEVEVGESGVGELVQFASGAGPQDGGGGGPGGELRLHDAEALRDRARHLPRQVRYVVQPVQLQRLQTTHITDPTLSHSLYLCLSL